MRSARGARRTPASLARRTLDVEEEERLSRRGTEPDPGHASRLSRARRLLERATRWPRGKAAPIFSTTSPRRSSSSKLVLRSFNAPLETRSILTSCGAMRTMATKQRPASRSPRGRRERSRRLRNGSGSSPGHGSREARHDDCSLPQNGASLEQRFQRNLVRDRDRDERRERGVRPPRLQNADVFRVKPGKLRGFLLRQPSFLAKLLQALPETSTRSLERLLDHRARPDLGSPVFSDG